MKRFDILPHAAKVAVKATASTKAGLLSASLQGMFAAAGPKFKIEDPVKDKTFERPFSVTSKDFSSLLVDVLNAAVASASANRESYEDVSLSLITDTKAEGKFVGRAVSGFDKAIKAATHRDLNVQKNVVGLWETVITFDV